MLIIFFRPPQLLVANSSVCSTWNCQLLLLSGKELSLVHGELRSSVWHAGAFLFSPTWEGHSRCRRLKRVCQKRESSSGERSTHTRTQHFSCYFWLGMFRLCSTHSVKVFVFFFWSRWSIFPHKKISPKCLGGFMFSSHSTPCHRGRKKDREASVFTRNTVANSLLYWYFF